MNTRYIFAVVALTALGGALNAQTERRKMTMVGGGSRDRGKCTIEVVVDGTAEVEIRGDSANLRNLGGAMPRWRRFECTGPVPANPGDFHFAGVDGRGRQQLMHDPRSGGAAVVRIDDPDGGAEGYTFDITWGSAPPPVQSRGPVREENRGGDRDRDHDGDSFYRDRADVFRGEGWRNRLFGRIREDLDHVQSVTFPFGSDQYRLARAKQELDQLQDMLAHGRYDRRELEDVAGALRKVLADNRLSSRDRDVLSEDLDHLQNFREHSRDYGIR